MEFAQACGPLGVRPIVGAELAVAERPRVSEPFHLTLLVEDATGWANLCRTRRPRRLAAPQQRRGR